ncbi:Tsr2p KNAG_0B06420 [Huiozyma naganishii CBS 8797]|uniref:Pre-rRNA-processing protein TSR2 n=1 Tax=Huiozyma naganishii (strain ATCC MYA-139 / BCRC 22969 / CBS 8797 / KCTC 17520 / NBRC 10181 / NCYC 3082 / Yp74L-3) TaxID=1071383 RepID=J7R2M6_HUIN7|nr:hypothetical protein KNAG_0B06420 [Kazachstania naganishii CBS 8797]CCK69070.1 hypothetical protein KNAG_0B06420 [Kazachstania naganishii CBS 8797]
MSSTDQYAVIECDQGQNSLLFGDEKQQARFELGLSMLVHGWDSLDIAVVNQWGGPESADKRDWITSVVVDLFKENKTLDSAVLEETLLYAMFDEFDTHVDDGSAQMIALGMLKLYDECRQLNFNTVEKLYGKWMEKQRRGVDTTRYVQINEVSGTDDEGDEDEDDEDEDMGMDGEMEANAGIPELTTAPEPVVDDDGFELVQKKGKRRH